MPEIVLHQFAPCVGQDSSSPFCTKVHRLLTLKGLAYRTQTLTNPLELKRLNPRIGKLPVLSYDGTLVPDSTRIARFLEERHPEPTLWPGNERQRALVNLIEDWADESLYWNLVYVRWKLDDYFEPFARHAFAFAPAAMRPLVARFARRRSLRMLFAQGTGRLARDVVMAQVAAHLDMVAGIVAETGWLAGGAPSLADAAVFAIVQGLHSKELRETRELVQARPAVVDWAGRFDEASRGPHTAEWG